MLDRFMSKDTYWKNVVAAGIDVCTQNFRLVRLRSAGELYDDNPDSQAHGSCRAKLPGQPFPIYN